MWSFHYFAFPSPAVKVNLVPQLKEQNRHGEWRQMEKEWAKEQDKGRDVEVEILVEYTDDGSTPSLLRSTFTIDGVRQEPLEFYN